MVLQTLNSKTPDINAYFKSLICFQIMHIGSHLLCRCFMHLVINLHASVSTILRSVWDLGAVMVRVVRDVGVSS
jgi:hypothetical protein